FFFSSRRRHTRSKRDWSSDVCSSDLATDFTRWSRLREKMQEKCWIRSTGGRKKYIRNTDIISSMLEMNGTSWQDTKCRRRAGTKIGRASCRERVKRDEMVRL